MYEVELKVSAEHAVVRDTLKRVGASHIESVQQEDTYYDAPDREFVETDEALRIRRETTDGGTNRTAVTYKGPLVEEASKTREEAETYIEDDEAMHAVLTGLGYEAAATVTKTRERYTLDDCTVTLDTVEGVGEFVEVERDAKDTEQALSAARADTIDVLEQLGLDHDDQIRTSYLDLLLSEGDSS
ncbi:class IV adenylate cyclase [Halovenus rubra]|uniref:Class IV adenylate cyclase n=2 Tax=Halovenus rubra TaxID=869890 RepID=A0ACC7E507_9EURY|nr:class IV adenylate cyclase [Halovenus rubra]